MANIETNGSEEFYVGNNKLWKLLGDLKADVLKFWKTAWWLDWDKAVQSTDILTKKDNELILIRNKQRIIIASLKADIATVEKKSVPTTKKEISVVVGDSISKILVKEFWKNNFSYGDKSGPTNMKEGWDKIAVWEKLIIETDWQKNENDRYLYTLSRDKNGKKESITFVSSTLLLQSNTTTSEPQDPKKVPPVTVIPQKTLVIDSPNIAHPTPQALEKAVRVIPETVNSLTVENLQNIFPQVDSATLKDLLAGKPVHLKGASYQLAKLEWTEAVVWNKKFKFAEGVKAESNDIILVTTNKDSTQIALAFQKLKTGKYSTQQR